MVAAPCVENVRELRREHQPPGRHLQYPPGRVIHQVEMRIRPDTVYRHAFRARPQPQPRPDSAHGFGRHHARQMIDVLQCGAGPRFGQADRDVLALGLMKIDIDYVIDGVLPLHRDNQHGNRHRDADAGHRRAKGPAKCMPQQHSCRLIEQATMGKGAARISCRRRRLHRLRRRQENGATNGRRCASERHSETDQSGDRIHAGARPIQEKREAVELGIQLGVVASEPGSQGESDEHA